MGGWHTSGNAVVVTREACCGDANVIERGPGPRGEIGCVVAIRAGVRRLDVTSPLSVCRRALAVMTREAIADV